MELKITINVSTTKPEGILKLQVLIKGIQDGSLQKEMLEDSDMNSINISVERIN